MDTLHDYSKSLVRVYIRWVLCAARYVFLQRTLKTKGGQGGGPRRAVRPPFDT